MKSGGLAFPVAVPGVPVCIYIVASNAGKETRTTEGGDRPKESRLLSRASRSG